MYTLSWLCKKNLKIFIYLIGPVLPQILPFEFGEEAVHYGELTSLTCSITKGDLPIQISWLHNNRPVDVSMQFVSVVKVNKKISTLSIDSARAEHAGNYTCVAENPAGSAAHTTQLFVNGTFVINMLLLYLLLESTYLKEVHFCVFKEQINKKVCLLLSM